MKKDQSGNTNAYISLTNVRHCYRRDSLRIGMGLEGQNQVLNDVSLDISQGSLFGLLGPNGAGKTTLISLLTGVIPLQKGRVSIAGYQVPVDRDEIKKISSLVPQEYSFYPSLSGRENLLFFGQLYGLSGNLLQERIDYCVEVCGLQQMFERRAQHYSGGVKRRLNLAIGLLNKPSILYLDEPTVGIDAQSRHFILNAIKSLQTQGMTIIYTSHYMEEVQAICDDIAVIDHGRVLVQTSLTELLKGEASKKLVVELCQPLSDKQERVLSSFTTLLVTGQKITMDIEAENNDIYHFLSVLQEMQVGIDRMYYGARPLEEVYLSMTELSLRD